MTNIFISISKAVRSTRFGAFLHKEFLHILRDRRTLIILFGIPLAQLLLFGYALTNEVKNVNIAIADYSHDEMTKKIIEKIDASTYFNITQIVHSPSEYDDLLRSGKVKEIVVFEPNFSEKYISNGKADVQLLADASEPNTAQLIINYTSSIINTYGLSEEAQTNNPANINIKIRMLYNENMKEAYNFVPGLFAMILMLISAMMTAITITREKETGTMEILLASPLKPFQIILGKVTPYFCLSIINAAVILVIGTQLFGVPVKGCLCLLVFEILLYIFLALSLGVMISSVVSNQMAALAMSGFGLMMPTILLSGFLFPVKNMPLALQILSNVIPPRWFVEINRSIMIKGDTLAVLWPQTLILMGFAALFLFVSFRKFKIRLE